MRSALVLLAVLTIVPVADAQDAPPFPIPELTEYIPTLARSVELIGENRVEESFEKLETEVNPAFRSADSLKKFHDSWLKLFLPLGRLRMQFESYDIVAYERVSSHAVKLFGIANGAHGLGKGCARLMPRHIAGLEHPLAEPAATLALQRSDKIVTTALELVGDFQHVVGTLVIGQSGPVREGSLRRFNGTDCHPAIAVGDTRPDRAVRRVQVVKRTTCRHPGPADIKVVEGSCHLSLPCFHERAIPVTLEHLDLGLSEHRDLRQPDRLFAVRFGSLCCRRPAHMARFTRLLCRCFEIGQHCGNAFVTTSSFVT